MEPKELIPVPHSESQNETPKIGENIESVFGHMPENIRKECFEYFSGLPKQIADRIEAGLLQKEGSGRNSISEIFDIWNKEDRANDGVYTREDIAEFDDITLELKLRSNMQEMFGRYLKSRVMKVGSYEEFKGVMDDFVNSVWSNRRNGEIVTPERGHIEEMGKRRSEFFGQLRALEEKEREIEQRIGNRKRIPNHVQAELDEVQSALGEVRSKRFGMDYEHMDVRGARSEAVGYEKKFKAGIYFSEYFSAEDYAVLLLEIMEDEINHASRFDMQANPELLDFTSKFFEEWARSHEGEKAFSINDKARSDKTERLIQRFVVGLQSYVRHRDDEDLSESQKDSLTRELPIILRMLQKVSE